LTLADGTVVDDFRYDASGNMIAGNGRFIDYDALGKPIAISEGNAATSFWYGSSGARYKQVCRGGGQRIGGARLEGAQICCDAARLRYDVTHGKDK
jgi:hypothetical protein